MDHFNRCNDLPLSLYHKSNHREHMKKWEMPYSSKMLFTKTTGGPDTAKGVCWTLISTEHFPQKKFFKQLILPNTRPCHFHRIIILHFKSLSKWWPVTEMSEKQTFPGRYYLHLAFKEKEYIWKWSSWLYLIELLLVVISKNRNIFLILWNICFCYYKYYR